MTIDSVSSREQVNQSARILVIGTIASRIAGFIRDVLLAAYFNRTVTDCFVVAFRLPNLFRRVLGEGALASSFLPVLIGTYHEGHPTSRSRNLINSLSSLLVLTLIALTLSGVFEIEPLMTTLVGGAGFRSVPGKLEMATQMARWMFPFVALVSLYTFGTAILHSVGRFSAAATAPLFFNLTLIAIILFVPTTAATSSRLGCGVLLGGLVQLLILVPSLRQAQLWPRWQRPHLTNEVRVFLMHFAPTFLGTGLLQIIGLLNVYFASLLPEGSHSYLYWVDRLVELPMSLIGASLGTALLPALTHAHHKNSAQQLSELITHSLKVATFWLTPFIVGMLCLAQPTIEVIYQRGYFTAHDAVFTAQLLQIAAMTLFAGTLMRTISPLYYACHRPWLAAVLAFISLMFHFIIAWITVHQFGLIGLAWATAMSTVCHLILAFTTAARLLVQIKWQQLQQHVWRLSVAGAAMALILLMYPWLKFSFTRGGIAISYFGITATGFFVFLGTCHLLGLGEFAKIKR
jgi:putative peptidoglycan lipid II flippase